MHILVVDDDASARESLSETLRKRGHLPASCESAEAAVPMVPYVDGVIVDGLYGGCWDLLDQIQQLGKPAVLHTGDDDLAERARAEGIPCRLKPADIDELLEALRVEVAA